MNKEITLLHLFYRFLKLNNVFNSFKYNVTLKSKESYRYKINYIKNELSDSLISNAFTWANTKEGHEFWENIDDKWCDIISKYNLECEYAHTKISNNTMFNMIKNFKEK